MNEYMTLIMGAAFVFVSSIVIMLVTRKGLHKKDTKQGDLNFPKEPKVEQPQREMVAGVRR
jgi:hypothetical protein